MIQPSWEGVPPSSAWMEGRATAGPVKLRGISSPVRQTASSCSHLRGLPREREDMVCAPFQETTASVGPSSSETIHLHFRTLETHESQIIFFTHLFIQHMEIDSLGSIGLFVRVAERLGFSAVARELGLSPSAVGKAVARLEERLGVRLFNRSTRTLALTAEGERFLERCRRILCEVEAAQQELRHAGERPQGRLKVSLPRHCGLFEQALSDFLLEYPEVELDLNFSDHLVDVIGDGFDVAIRAAPLQDSGLKHRRLGGFRRVLVGSPAYFQRHGRPVQPADLARHQCLHYRYPATGRLERWPLGNDDDTAPPALPSSVVCNSVEMRIFLALRGQGIACLPDFTVARQLEQGLLQTVLDPFTANAQGTVWMVWPPGRDLSPKVRAFLEFMAHRLFA